MLVPVAATGDLAGVISASARQVVISHSAEVPDIRAAIRMRFGADGYRALAEWRNGATTPGTPPP